MNSFVSRCVIFSALLGALGVASLAFNSYLFSSLSYAAPIGVTTFVAGDSRAVHGLSPDELPATENIAMAAEGLTLTLAKLRHALPRSPAVTTVVVTVSPLNVAATNDEPFAPDWQAKIARRYHGIASPLTHPGFRLSFAARVGEFVRWRLTPSTEYVSRWIANIRGRDWRSPAFDGGFVGRMGRRRDFEVPDALIVARFGAGGGALSMVHARALRDVVELCAIGGQRLVLLRMPVHRNYGARIPTAAERSFAALIQALPRDDVWEYVDLSQEVLPDAYFYDWDHLNAIGAREVSRHLASRISAR